MENLDDDDLFLISQLSAKGKSTSEIAQKLGHGEILIKEVLQASQKNKEDYIKCARKCFKEKNFQEAAFWFYQHGIEMHLLGDTGKKYAKYSAAVRRAELNYPGFNNFLVKETEEKNIDRSTTWEKAQALWIKKCSTYQTDEEINQTTFESKCGKQGGEAISIEDEEHHMNAVCKIKFNNGTSPGCGSLFKLDDSIGILTNHQVIKDKDSCKNAMALFDTIDGTEIPIKLLPDKVFFSSKELDTVFVACNYQENEDEEVKPLEKTGSVVKDAPIYCYFHLDGAEKISIQQKVSMTDNEIIRYDGDVGEGAAGAPVYCADKVVGVNQTKKAGGSGNSASDINAILKWLQQQKHPKDLFNVGDKVMARWVDNYEYPAKIQSKTTIGYRVIYDGFNEVEDIPVERIRVVATNKSSSSSSSSSSTTTTTTTTESKVTEENAAVELDEDDIELIESSLAKGWDPQKIASKLHSEEKLILEYIEKKKAEDNFDQKKWDELVDWLDKMRLKKYADSFRSCGYVSIDLMLAWPVDQRTSKLVAAGCKGGSMQKIVNSLQASRVYKPDAVLVARGSAKIKSIKNDAMAQDWTPQSTDLNLTEYFRRDDGSSSIRATCGRLKSGDVPKEINAAPGQSCFFYVESTSYNRFFKITINWDNK